MRSKLHSIFLMRININKKKVFRNDDNDDNDDKR